MSELAEALLIILGSITLVERVLRVCRNSSHNETIEFAQTYIRLKEKNNGSKNRNSG